MIVYVLPGVGRFGGVKVGFQFVELLRSLGVPMVVATPGGEAPRWFRSSVPVVARESTLPELAERDVVVFSLPQDFTEVACTGARIVLHCQGTDPAIDPIVADPRVTTLTCWDQAGTYVASRTDRDPIHVGISVSDVFMVGGRPRRRRSIAYMPRRGWVDRIEHLAHVHDLELIRIDGDDELEVAAKMASAEVFAAVAEGEWFGLPALEAMASGCVVLSVPTIGGTEYLDDDVTALVRPIDRFGEALGSLFGRDGAASRERLRSGARRMALRYRRSLHRSVVAAALDGPLGEVLR